MTDAFTIDIGISMYYEYIHTIKTKHMKYKFETIPQRLWAIAYASCELIEKINKTKMASKGICISHPNFEMQFSSHVPSTI